MAGAVGPDRHRGLVADGGPDLLFRRLGLCTGRLEKAKKAESRPETARMGRGRWQYRQAVVADRRRRRVESPEALPPGRRIQE